MQITLRHIVFPVICVLAGVISQYSGLDISLEQVFYDNQHHLWPYKDTWITQNLLHKGGRDFIVLVIIGMMMFFIFTLLNNRMKQYRRSAGFLLFSTMTGIGIVAALKSSTHIYSPWDLKQFGGLYPHIRLFDSVPGDLPVGHAFPAGHASGGFALLSLYFISLVHQHHHRNLFLIIALAIGLLFGVDQEIRGAHMLSHDMFSLAICWSSCLAWSAFLPPVIKQSNNDHNNLTTRIFEP